jgi:hypothetical protein
MLGVREVAKMRDIRSRAPRQGAREWKSSPAEIILTVELRRAQALTRSVKTGMPSGSRSSGPFRKSGGMPAARARRAASLQDLCSTRDPRTLNLIDRHSPPHNGRWTSCGLGERPPGACQ